MHSSAKLVLAIFTVVGLSVYVKGYGRLKFDLPVTSKDVDVSLYRWENPTSMLKLPTDLVEISGLSYLRGDLIAINDELGLIYYLDRDTGAIRKTKHFALRGDYEGIAVVPHGIGVIRSDGILYSVTESETQHVNTGLLGKNVEGLHYFDSEGVLLLAAKGFKSETDKIIYAFDYDHLKIQEQPFIAIEPSNLWEQVKADFSQLDGKKQRKVKQRIKDFSPSGVVVDEVSCYTYVLSARGSTLLVYDGSRKLQDVVLLDEDLIPQPEGIAIDEQQTIYIASEGKSTRGRLFHYKKVR